ncbi:Syntaxin-71, partial [Cucurbita argyrosperma subsp. sororia]
MKKKQYSNNFYLHVSASFFLLPLFFISLAYAKITVIDLIFRVDSVCQRYEKYDVQKQRELNAYGDGVFSRLFAAVELEIHAALQIRAAAVAMNAEVRRKKARLMDEVPKLCKLALKKELNSQVPLIDEIDSKVRFRPKLPHQCRFPLYNSWNRFLLVQYMKLSWIKSLLFKSLNYGIALSCEVNLEEHSLTSILHFNDLLSFL